MNRYRVGLRVAAIVRGGRDRLRRSAVALCAVGLLLSPGLAQAGTGTARPHAPAVFQPWLSQQLTTVAANEPMRVAVRGTSLARAVAALDGAGLRVQQRWPLVDIAVGVGTAQQVRALRGQPGLRYVEGDRPLALALSTAHEVTRSNRALAAFRTFAGRRVDGAGVSIAIIDSGIDGTHPMFQRGGRSAVAANLKNLCGQSTGTPLPPNACFQQVPSNDTDTISGGGHGTHVAGIAGGSEVVTPAPAGTRLRGAAPGVTLIGLSAGIPTNKILDGAAASNWVLEHQQNPCRPADAQTVSDIDRECPPIRVTNHSYGAATNTTEGNRFDPNSAEVVIQRALVNKGVVSVWSAGNSGGDGSRAFTNPPGMDPTPGIVMVANYDDGGTAQRDGQLDRTSSRGEEGEPDSYPDLAAPGTRITSACRTQLTVCSSGDPITGGADGVDYATISGTSMAAPYVAAVAAQLFQTDPRLTPARIEHLLKKTAYRFTAGAPYETDPTGGRTSFDKGHGLIDVYAALAAARPLTTRR